MPYWSLNWVKLAVAAVALLTAFSAGWNISSTIKKQEIAELKLQWAKQTNAALEAQKAELVKARKTEADLQEALLKQKKESEYERKKLAGDYERVLGELRKRPVRPSDVGNPTNPAAGLGSGTSCTAAQLYREDAEVALRIARDADDVRIALDSCVKAYNQARDKLTDHGK